MRFKNKNFLFLHLLVWITVLFATIYFKYFQETIFADPLDQLSREFETIRQEITDSRGNLKESVASNQHLRWWMQTFSDSLSIVLEGRSLQPEKYADPEVSANIKLALRLFVWILWESQNPEVQILRLNIAYKSKSVQKLWELIQDYEYL